MRAALLILLACWYPLFNANTSPQPLQVTVQQLIQKPDAFNGKMVSTVGYYTAEHHGPYLCADAKTATQGAAGAWRIHLDLSDTSLPLEALKRVQHGYVRIIGRFQHRNMKITTRSDGARMIPSGFGWMNTLDKQITNITTFQNVPAPRQ
jgi:hypothetical protein